MRKSRQHGFTLAELLSVLVILAIVLSIALPAVTNLVKANALSSAARGVCNALSLARQYAITHRTTTRVVFPYIDPVTGSSPGPGTNQAPCYISYAAISIDPYGQTTNYITRWEFLPTGVVFLHDTYPLSTVIGALDNGSWLQHGLIPFPYTNTSAFLPPQRLAYIEFGPTGAASNPGTLTIKEGFINNAGFPQLTPASPPNWRRFVVDNIVGHIQVIAP
jgi:prepilin-type N-terminal cleavage/methylation domain-containing protein